MSLSKQNFCVILFALILGVCNSFANVFDHPVNAKSKQKLEKALAKVMDYEVASGDFKQTKSIKKRNRNFVTTGTFRISKKNGISWNTKKPIVSELALNNGGIFERDANGQTRMILPKDNPIFADLSKNIQALFSGKVSELETKFQVFYEKKSCGFTMGLVPREGMLRMVVANIVIEACKNIDKAVITDGENSPMTFEFMNYKIIGNTSPNQEDVTP